MLQNENFVILRNIFIDDLLFQYKAFFLILNPKCKKTIIIIITYDNNFMLSNIKFVVLVLSLT